MIPVGDRMGARDKGLRVRVCVEYRRMKQATFITSTFTEA